MIIVFQVLPLSLPEARCLFPLGELFVTPCACFLMTEAFLADEAMQDEQVACYFIPAGEGVWNFAGLHCSTSPWAQGLLAADLTRFAVQGESHMVAETREHRSELKSLCSALFLKTHRCCNKPGSPARIVLPVVEKWSQQAEDLLLGQR